MINKVDTKQFWEHADNLYRSACFLASILCLLWLTPLPMFSFGYVVLCTTIAVSLTTAIIGFLQSYLSVGFGGIFIAWAFATYSTTVVERHIQGLFLTVSSVLFIVCGLSIFPSKVPRKTNINEDITDFEQK